MAANPRLQNGHRGSHRSRTMATAMRIVTSALGKCRSGRALERAVDIAELEVGSGGKRSRLFGSEEREAAEHDGDVVIPSGIGATFEVVESELAFEVFVGPLGTPSQIGRASCRERGENS